MGVRPRLSYANVIATVALFLTLTGGAVWAASKISGKQIKANSLPGNRIKKGSLAAKQIKNQAITNAKIKPGTIQRTLLAAGTLPGLIVAESSAANLPGATTATPPGPTPVALGGTTSFTPAAGKSYQLQAELFGNPQFEAPSDGCEPAVQVYVNGIPTTFLNIFAGVVPAGNDSRFPEASNTTNLLTESGLQSISAKVFGDTLCSGATTLDRLRIVVVELG